MLDVKLLFVGRLSFSNSEHYTEQRSIEENCLFLCATFGILKQKKNITETKCIKISFGSHSTLCFPAGNLVADSTESLAFKILKHPNTCILD